MSHKVLAPVIHKDAYTRAIERELVAWFRETVFTPLLIQLMDAGVPVDPKYQEIRFDEEGRQNAATMELYDPALGGLGMKRKDLPQIAPEIRGALISWLSSHGVAYRDTTLRPGQIKPTQEGFYPEAVERGRQFLGKDDSPLLVSSDGYLLDGHHRWTTALIYAPDDKLRAWVFSLRVRPLLALMNEFGGAEHENAATSAVRAALQSGQIHYADGKFTGRFSSSISKELRSFGATFNPEQKTFSIPVGQMPPQLSASVVESIDKSRHLHEDVISTLAEMERNVTIAPVGLGVELSAAVDRIILDAGRQFTASLTSTNIAVPAEFTPAMTKQMAEELTNNLELYVKDFTQEMILDLRQTVQQNALTGMRTDKLARIIEAKFGVSKRKADFLADQETGLLMAKYRESRYSDIGVQEYIWSTSHDVRVRADHARLDGKRFAYSSPPVTNLATGARNNPGEDFRCRCVPRPIINLIPA